MAIQASRRTVLSGALASAALPLLNACGAAPAEAKTFRVNLTDAQWREKLTPTQYSILRQEATERPFSSPLDTEKREGMFLCAGCQNELYPSRTKYDSKSGWPSFWAPADKGAVATTTDYKIGYPRTEVHCADCGGHLGHIFDDGPKPTGKRHCINGGAMKFIPA